MKTSYRALAVVLLLATMAGSLQKEQISKASIAGSRMVAPQLFKLNQNKKAAPDPIPENTIAMIQQDIAKREYHITRNKEKGSLQSPNRKQNLRAYYKPGELVVQNRIDSSGHNFKLKLVTEGIYADGKKLFSPQAEAQSAINENILHIQHEGFTEEYINNEQGVRQNFIVSSVPMGTERLEVRLSADGLKVRDLGANKLQFESQSGEQLTYSDLKCWDANGKALNASLAYVGGLIGIDVNVEGAVFPVTVDPILVNAASASVDKILYGDASSESFGASVSSAGDVNGDGYGDIIVGAPHTYGDGQGYAFMYLGSSTGVNTLSATLTVAQTNSQFASSVASAGDINGDGFSDIVIGAYKYEYETLGGAAFVYYGSAKGIDPSYELLSCGQKAAFFGASVSSAGDVNGDGYSDVLIGSPNFDNGLEDIGACFVYHGSADGLSNVPAIILKPTGNLNLAYNYFGESVASAGDVNGDGYSDVIIGSSYYDSQKGAAYVYSGSASGIQNNYLIRYVGIHESTINHPGSLLGACVASAGDFNGDGYSDIITGESIYNSDNAGDRYKLLHIYFGSSSGPGANPSMSIKNPIADNIEFNAGDKYACAGDINGDGFSDIIINAWYYDYLQSKIFSATMVFKGAANNISDLPYLSFVESGNDYYAWSVNSAGDVNGDGFSDMIFGSPDPNGKEFASIAHGSASAISASPIASGSGLQVNERLGFSLTNAGDLNGDGFNDIAIGAPYHSVGGQNNGLIRVQYGSLSGINFGNFQTLETLNAGALFGYSTSSAGDVNGDGYADLLVGASNYSNGENLEGAVFVYHGSPTGVASFPSYIIEGNEVNAQFGFSTSGAGDINGDGYSDIIASGINNKVLVYFGSANGLKLGTPSTLTNNGFAAILGRSVAGIGDFNGDGYDDVCASLNSSSPGNAAGTALVFLGSQNGIETKSSINLNMQGLYCQTVSAAGDVNGDGFMDIIVGTPTFSNGESNEGAAFVYHGTSDKGIINPSTQKESNQANASMGYSVAGAGDVNGDGYSDVIVSAPFYGNNENNEGMVNLYLGSPTGIVNVAQTSLEGNVANGLMGMAVSGAGDVNGDGYSEMLVGLPQRDVLYSNAGLVQLYAGNGGYGLRNNIRLYNANLSENISHKNISEDDFGLGLYSKSFLGRSKAKLIWETRKEGEAFSYNNLLSTSVDYTDKSGYQVGLGIGGIEMKSLPLKVGKSTRIRARIKYDPSLAITGQLYGPWKYLPGNSLSQATPLPVTLISFTAERSEKNVNLEWITATEENSESFEVQRSKDGKTWQAIGKRAAKGNSTLEEHYTFTDSTAKPGQNFYRLKMTDLDHTYTFSRVRSVSMAGITENLINLFPNPTIDKLILQTEQLKVTNLKIVSAAGNVVLETANPGLEVDVKQIKTGVYIVVIELENGTSVSKSIVKK